MESTQGKSRRNQVNPDRKNIRLMTTGMSILLSILPAIGLLEIFGLQAIWPQVSVALLMIGIAFFCAGLIGRQELAAKRKEEGTQTDEGN